MFEFVVRLIVLFFVMLFPAQHALADHAPWHPPDPMYEIVVELERSQSPTVYYDYFLGQLGVDSTERPKRLVHVYMYAITGFSVLLTEEEIALMEYLFDSGAFPGTKNVARSQEVTIPERESLMPESPIRTHDQVIPTGIQRIQAMPKGNMGNVDVAVIDTGVDARHPDLNVVGGVNCVDRSGDEAALRDQVGHGTHVAGTIGARDNGMGVVGVAPGARIWSVKVLDDTGYGTWGSVLCGIDWVTKMADTIEVANMSLGGRGYKTACGEDDPMHNAVCFSSKRVIYVVAAGNSTDDVAGYTPAGYKEAVTVSALADFDGQPGGAALAPDNRCAAMSVDDELAAFSNYGEGVDIAAPGTCILSTLPGNVTKDGEYIPAYGYASGTSMATPHVTGAIARFLSENPDQRDEAWQQVLMWSSSHELLAEGDHDAVPEPVLYVGNGTPRYVPGKNAPPGS